MAKSRRSPDQPVSPMTRALRQAQRLMETGQYAQAYAALKRLADKAMRDEMPLRAAHLYAQAARARLEMGSAPDTAALAQRAVQLLAGAGQASRAGVLLARLIQALRTQGYHDLAISLRAEIAALGGRMPSAAPAQPGDNISARPGDLPAQCPTCAGAVRRDEVIWIDEWRIACGFCGSIFRAG